MCEFEEADAGEPINPGTVAEVIELAPHCS